MEREATNHKWNGGTTDRFNRRASASIGGRFGFVAQGWKDYANILAADGRASTTQQTAPQNNAGSRFEVTHPFHPLRGQQFDEEGRTGRWGDQRVWFRLSDTGRLRTIPLSFTSLAPADPYLEFGNGANWHRVSELLRLRQLIDVLGREGSRDL